ncbi:MAG TPA: DNA repair exonuclease [Sphingobacteriaceae bacterium]|nr:DNA repair exonuclease [Sphingobacteriaceae bacterium]
MKILCSGDLHIGRRASRLPATVAGLDGRAFTASQAWLDLVETALDLQVDLVLLSGDVVDRANRYFEAFGPLEQGLSALAQAQIPVVAVAGNHDFDVLPKLARSFEAEKFRLLGARGQWERHTIYKDGRAVLHIDGWSFPDQYVRQDPLAGYRPDPADGVPVIGLLHCDLDKPQSLYAPVASADLQRMPVSFWLLGHIHGPMLRQEAGRPGLLYPGSPMALDPGEPGLHGPWLLTVEPDGAIEVQQLPRSRVRYETVNVDLTGLADLNAVDERIAETLSRRLAAAVLEQGDSLRCLVATLNLHGATPLHRSLSGLSSELSDLDPRHQDAVAVVGALWVNTRPPRDLAALAEKPGPPGVLAKDLLALGRPGDPRREELLAAARSVVEGAYHGFRSELNLPFGLHPAALLRGTGSGGGTGDGPDAGQGDAGPDDILAALLEQQGLLLLDELLAQREEEA